MNEWLMILSMAWSTTLFAVGGTKGKYWRRFVLPIGLAGMALLNHHWWVCLAYAVILSAFLHLGYGDRCSWLKRAFIFTGYGCAALVFALTWWALIVPLVCLGLFKASNSRLTEKSFPWKVCEAGMGFLIGAAYCSAV